MSVILSSPDGRESRGGERSLPPEEPRSCLRNMCLPATGILPAARAAWVVFQGKGPFAFIVWGAGGLTAHVTALSALPSSIPVTASLLRWSDALPPVRRLRAVDRGAAQATPPRAHSRRRSAAGLSRPDGAATLSFRYGLGSFLPCRRGPLGRSLLRGCCSVY